jgi:hypothetical protein
MRVIGAIEAGYERSEGIYARKFGERDIGRVPW